MCGLAGFSLSKGSRVNARRLSNALLKQIEQRGKHASGFAYSDHNRSGFHKAAVPGGQLPLSGMPRNTKTVILHTRFATHGSINDNTNNHPVMSPNRKIALTHNGVISNHDVVRALFSEEDQALMPDVDTAVLPALVSRSQLTEVGKLSGYAAVAWLDSEDRGALNLARLESSPVIWTQLVDGSFVYASTQTALSVGLASIGLAHGAFFVMPEKEYFRVVNGVVMVKKITSPMRSDRIAYGTYSSATAGGHGRSTYSPPPVTSYPPRTGHTPAAKAGSEDNVVFQAGTGANVQQFTGSNATAKAEIDEYLDDLVEWRKNRDEADNEAALSGRPMAVYGFGMGDDGDDDDDDDPRNEGYYVIDNDGDVDWFVTLELMEASLRWRSRLTADQSDPFPDAEIRLRWCNTLKDIGSINSKGDMESWVEDMARVDQHESPAVRNLGYVREGIGMLLTRKGA